MVCLRLRLRLGLGLGRRLLTRRLVPGSGRRTIWVLLLLLILLILLLILLLLLLLILLILLLLVLILLLIRGGCIALITALGPVIALRVLSETRIALLSGSRRRLILIVIALLSGLVILTAFILIRRTHPRRRASGRRQEIVPQVFHTGLRHFSDVAGREYSALDLRNHVVSELFF